MSIDFTQPTALFGGTFDPVHNGHLHIIRAIKAARYVLIVVPANQSPGKEAPLASGPLRSKWLKQLAAREGFSVWDTEIERGGASYTVDTLEEAHRLGAKKENLFWVVGSDAYASLSTWKDPERIRALAKILVLERPGTPVKLTHPGDILLKVPTHSASSTAVRAGLGSSPTVWQDVPAALKPELENLLRSQNPYARKT